MVLALHLQQVILVTRGRKGFLVIAQGRQALIPVLTVKVASTPIPTDLLGMRILTLMAFL